MTGVTWVLLVFIVGTWIGLLALTRRVEKLEDRERNRRQT